MEFISLHKSIKNTSWSGKILRALWNTGRGTWTPERTRRSPAEPGRTRKWWRKGKRKRRRMGPAKPCGDLKRTEVSISREAPHCGELSWDIRGASFSVGREHGNQRGGQSKTCMQATDPCTAHTAWEGVLRCRQGLCAETWGSEGRPRQRTEVAREETSWVDRREGGTLQMGRLWRKPEPPQKQSGAVEWCPKGRTYLQPLPPCACPCLSRH